MTGRPALDDDNYWIREEAARMSDEYPQRDQPTEAHDFDETVRRPPARPAPPAGPMARPVMPVTQASRFGPSGGEGEPPEKSGLYVPWWGFALVILVVAGITCGLWGVVLMNRGDTAASGGPTPTPIFVVITASPTAGVPATITPGPIASASAGNATPTNAIPITTTPGGSGITIGVTIVVAGTGGDGLAVRQGPGIDFTPNFRANDGEKFKVQDGPKDADGYTWWYIVDVNNANRFGWAVQNFMQVSP